MKLRIKELMKDRGISGLMLAERVGISNVALSTIATGKMNPSLDTLERIAKALDVEMSDLFAPEKNRFRCPRCGALLELRECEDGKE